MEFKTVEEAKARILELEEEKRDMQTQLDTLSQDKKNVEDECENLRTLNQKYFNKLIAQDEKKDDKGKGEDEDIPSCEEFAKTLNI